MGAFLGLVPEDENRGGDDEYAGQYPGGGYAEGYPTTFQRDGRVADRAAGMSGYPEPVTHGSLAVQLSPEARPVAESSAAARPLTVKLTGFGEARIIGERYRDGASVILDMTDLSDADARRVVDFAAGLAFALRGSIDKVTTRVFMLLPPHADLSAESRRAVAGSYAAR
jgi:cell division inhibitor SepF